MAREDLNPVEEARACAALVEELGLTREDVGLRVGRSRVAVSNLIRLLDLPDEALELIERGELTEGHGRALLLATDHGARRTLARDAAHHRWSVRELESRARAADAPPASAAARRSRTALHPDQAAAIELISDALGAALGREVDVAPAKGPATASSSASSRSTTRSTSPAASGSGPSPDRGRRDHRRRRPAPRPAGRIARVGRLAQSVRALL